MSAESRRRADERLAAALADAGVADRRDDYRDRLRILKRDNPDAFRRMTEHYERSVQPALLEGPDPLGAWVEFGVTLGGTSGPGRMTSIDATGRTVAWTGDCAAGLLLLWLPEDRQAEALPLLVPAGASAAQTATLDLLVGRKLSL